MKTISEEAVKVLGSMEVDGQLARITAGQLDRKLYAEVNKALESIGGKWITKLKAHRFDADPRDALDQVVLSGGFVDKKQEFGFFETPDAVADLLVEAAELRDGMSVLEPSAGGGRLIAAAMRTKRALSFTAVEIQRENVVKLERAFGSFGGLLVNVGDFLEMDPDMKAKQFANRPEHQRPPETRFDRVLMNPPFARQLDIAHVLHAYRFLKPGGRLVTVMSRGVLFRENKMTQDFRRFVEGLKRDFIPLPEAAFVSSGTNVRTVLLSLDKPA